VKGVVGVQCSGFRVQSITPPLHYSTEKACSSGLAETGYNLVVRVQGSGFRNVAAYTRLFNKRPLRVHPGGE